MSLLLLLCVAGCADDTGGKCLLETYGRMEVLNTRGSPVVRAGINGHPVAFIIDSGSLFTMIGRDNAARLDVWPSFGTGFVTGFGGVAALQAATIDSLDLGRSHASNFLIGVGGKFHGSVQGLPIAGVFGADFLNNYEYVIDMPDHEVRLMRTRGCEMPTPIWSGKIDSFPLKRFGLGDHKTALITQLDGRDVETYLDTGARRTVLTVSFAHDIGVTQAMLDKDRKITAFGIAGVPTTAYRHRFQTLQIGSTILHGVTLTVSDGLSDLGIDMLLGADFLRHYRVWIKPNDERGYFQHDVDIPADDPTRTHSL